MKDKILSISIAAYNVENYLRDTLDSLVDSDVIDLLDVIIVNDESTDSTAQIASEYVEKYPDSVMLVNKENGGYGSTINCALKHAKGKFIKLLDGDDWYMTENLSLFVRRLNETNADMVLTSYSTFMCDKLTPLNYFNPPYDSSVVLNVKELKTISMYSMAVRTTLVKDSVQITENCFYTDVEWFLKSALCCKSFEAFPVCVYCHRLGRPGQSVAEEGYLEHIAEHTLIAQKAVNIFNENKGLSGLEVALSEILERNYLYLLKSDRTIKNIKELLSFRKFIKYNAGYSVEHFTPMIKNVHRHMFLIFLSYKSLLRLHKIYRGCKQLKKVL